MMNMLIRKIIQGFLLGMLFVSNLSASETYWLSDIAPTKEQAKKMRPSHGGLVIRGRDGYTKKLWLRKGNDILNSSYVSQSEMPLVLVTPESQQSEIVFGNKAFADVSFKMPEEGFYNLFLIDRQIKDGVLQESVIKNESLNHSCRTGHDHTKEKMPPLYFDGVTFDLVRERLPRETFHTHMGSGDIINYRVMLNGKPVGGASVTMVTHKGWSKTVKTNPEGRASFEMIRDYYPAWHEFKKRNMETFLVIAEYHSVDGGVYEGENYEGVHYKATSAGNYYPSTRDYASYAYGLLIGLFGLTASIFFIYFHRKRRAGVYKEKRLA
ncbi:hypothetical protein ACFL0R_03065 [Pseudomonadota bacterium]